MTELTVGFIGAGAMGAPMVERLVAAGNDVTVMVRRSEVAAAMASLGATVVGTPAEVAVGADVVVLCVYTDEQVLEVGPDVVDAMRPGSVVVVHTTGRPSTAVALGARRPGEVQAIDAPVSGGPGDVRDGRITLLVGGSDDAVATARPALAAYGDPIVHLGALGAGQSTKLINNALLAAHVRLAADAERLARAMGVDPAQAMAAVTNGSGTSFAIELLSRSGSLQAMAAGVVPFLRKDVAVVVDVAADEGVDLGLLGELAAEMVEMSTATHEHREHLR